MNFFKKFQKLKVKEQTNKKRILSITVTAVGIACLLIGSSMAYLLFEASGTTQTISAGTLQLSYTNESEAIILNNAVPQSDEQGLNNNVYSITLTNTSTIKSYYELSLNNNCTVGNSYTVNGSSVTANVCIPNNYIKVAVKTNKDEDYTIKNGGNVILKGYLEAKENISFEMIIWLIEETPNDYQGQTETGTPRNVIYNGNFKIYTRQILDQNETLDSSGANAPILASNMIPVYYDETEEVWKKADANNRNSSYQWYSYESSGEYKGMWANAVTVTSDKLETYKKAEIDTTISMDDITTMWVWIPRFKVNTIDFTTIRGAETGGYCTDDNYNDIEVKTDCIALGYLWNPYYDNPGAIDVTFVKQNESALDAFTFGNKELSGFWFGKFETSHTTLASSTADNNLGCTNETCSNANGIIIKPNVTILRNNNISNFFFASRSMEQSNNSFGFVSSEVDTHMSKNNEWGAVAYLTQSIYGRCTSSTTCSKVYINNSGKYYTGRSGNIENAVEDYYEPSYKYNENKTQVVEKTGTNITPTITNDITYPWTNNNGIYSSINKYNDGENGSASKLIFSFTLTGKSVVSFDYSVSGHVGCSGMTFVLKKDSVEVFSSQEITGINNGITEHTLKYNNKKYLIDAGSYSLEFIYYTSDKTNGLDAGYVKNIKILDNVQISDEKIPGGQQASTTGTIYGIYDMRGGAAEYVMGVLADSNGNPRSGFSFSINSGFNGMVEYDDNWNKEQLYTNGVNLPDSKYYNLYRGTSYMGHALNEIVDGWHNSSNSYVDTVSPWFDRSSYFGSSRCYFCGGGYNGYLSDMISTRFVITNE